MKPCILLVDDEPRIIAALRIRLEEAGFEVRAASNGEQGLELAQQHRPAAMVLDLRMPGLTGFEVCEALQQDEALRRMPVIVLSANGDENTRRRAFDAGASDFLPKPYNSLDVLASLRAVLGVEARSRLAS
ncbi:response regulator [Planctomycetales bacterium ZRK34]|nr:response regulator [Planctomycetales bacterium ZRK34]